MNSAKDLIKHLWENYRTLVPSAKKIENQLRIQNEVWIEDHIALRSFNFGNFGSHYLEKYFEKFGWMTVKSDYKFPKKKLTALHMAHPDTSLPKIFISQIEVHELSDASVAIIKKYLSGKCDQLVNCNDLEDAISHFLNPVWEVPSYNDYLELIKESQYAAWTLLFGNNVNHFTISVHLMRQMRTLNEVNNFVESLGIELNQDNGKIKGSAEVLLEQSSTAADPILFKFADNQNHNVPYAFIEFARRYPLNQKGLEWKDFFQGFVEGNADRIFTSTNV